MGSEDYHREDIQSLYIINGFKELIEISGEKTMNVRGTLLFSNNPNQAFNSEMTDIKEDFLNYIHIMKLTHAAYRTPSGKSSEFFRIFNNKYQIPKL